MTGPSIEHGVAARVLTMLLRERFGSVQARVHDDGIGPVLVLAGGSTVQLSSGAPFDDLRVAPDARVPLSAAVDTVAVVAAPEDAAGVAAFADECAAEVMARTLFREHRADIQRRLGDDVSPIAAEARAAALGHPIHPTSLARVGLTAESLVAHAPEFAPRFRLRWAAVARPEDDRPPTPQPTPGPTPAWWPRPVDVGLAGDDPRALFPVHPVTVAALPETAHLAPEPFLDVRPTLSLRTVEVDDTTHLKLPVPVSTLGHRNRRSLTSTNLADGALAGRLLRAILPGDVLVADEHDTASAGDPYLSRLVRRLPVHDAVTVAALPAPVPGHGTVADVLAERHADGDRAVLLGRYLTRLLAWQVELLVRHGVAAETHQQNLAVRFDAAGRPQYVLKDHDSIRVAPTLLTASGVAVPRFVDPRVTADDVADLVDLFVTITLHLSAAAVAYALLPATHARTLLRQALAAALAPHGDDPTAALIRARTLDADRLVGKRMVTAATLVDKTRSGAHDVNRFYGTDVPNYLVDAAGDAARSAT